MGAILALSFVIIVVGSATVGDYFLNGQGILSSIEVPVEACPYLRPIHDLAVRLDDQWTRALGGRESWQSFRAELTSELPKLEAALKRAEPHLPARVASEFEVVVLKVRLGRAELPRATSIQDVLAPPGLATSPVLEGANALTNASGLIGNTCGYQFGQSALAP